MQPSRRLINHPALFRQGSIQFCLTSLSSTSTPSLRIVRGQNLFHPYFSSTSRDNKDASSSSSLASTLANGQSSFDSSSTDDIISNLRDRTTKANRFVKKVTQKKGGKAKSTSSQASDSTNDTDFKVDLSGLMSAANFLEKQLEGASRDELDQRAAEETQQPVQKSRETPLLKELQSQIKLTGPINLAEYVNQCASNPKYGYYMTRDVFGTQGDFVTSPEISQVFGELMCVWAMTTWIEMKKPQQLQIVELGPGRGSLMDDLLRSSLRFKHFSSCISDVHLVETSPIMRQRQQEKLGVTNIVELGTHLKAGSDNDSGPSISSVSESDGTHSSGPIMYGTSKYGYKVYWYEAFSNIPENSPFLLVAHELFDALPVQQFQYTPAGWCERLVDVDDSPDSKHHLRLVLSPGPTPAARTYLPNIKSELDPQLQLEKTNPEIAGIVGSRSSHPVIGDSIEICPLGMTLMEQITQRISRTSGVALCVDYGSDHSHTASLQGIRDHKYEDILCEPGLVDMSSWVDFSALARVVQHARRPDGAKYNVKAHPLSTQGEFLFEMGIQDRVNFLLEQNADSEATQDELIAAYERLLDPEQMGAMFKMFCVADEAIGTPPGFVHTSVAEANSEYGHDKAEGSKDEGKQMEQDGANEQATQNLHGELKPEEIDGALEKVQDQLAQTVDMLRRVK